MPAAQRLAAEADHASKARWLFRVSPLPLLIGFSVLFFLDISIRASEKYLWFDEIYTIIQSNLSLHALFNAIAAGFDFNPPLAYILTKLANFLFGNGLVATRLPEILGFWLFCICLFRFVSKRAGVLAGFCAMTLPMFSGAFYYGYDARPPGLVLGFCGVALLAWQSSLENRRHSAYLFALSLFLFAAFMTHCYAITLVAPFGLVELVRSARLQRMEYGRWAAVLIPLIVAALAYLPLLHAYRETERGTVWLGFSPAQMQHIGTFYSFLFAPCLSLLLLVVILLVLKQVFATGPSRLQDGLPESLRLETVLAAGFALLPVFGLLLALTIHSPFYERYFVASVAGFCILIGFGIGLGNRARWARGLIAGAFAVRLLSDVSLVAWHRVHGEAEALVEPSSGFSTNSSLNGALANYQMLVSEAKKGERIIVMWPMDFLYLVNYAPQLRAQLYYIAWDHQDVFYRILDRVHQYAPFQYHTMTADQFYASRADFMFFGLPADPGQLHVVGAADIELKSLKFSHDRFLADVSLRSPK